VLAAQEAGEPFVVGGPQKCHRFPVLTRERQALGARVDFNQTPTDSAVLAGQ